MKTLISLLTLSVALVVPAALQAKITRVVEKTFSVQPNGTLTVMTQGGDITVETADGNEVRVVATHRINTSSEKAADEILKKLALIMEQSGNEVTVETRWEKPAGVKRLVIRPSVQVDFVVTVPKEFAVNLTTSGGDISVAALTGNVKLRTSGGNLRLDRINGEVDGHTSGGDISLKEGTARADLRTSGENIVILRAGGPTVVSTSGGDVRVDSAAHLVRATTSGGNVTVTLTEPLKSDTEFKTSGGDVKVTLPQSAAFDLDASTTGGEVKARELKITVEDGGVGKRKLVGKVNGGGPKLVLRSSGGDVTVRTN